MNSVRWMTPVVAAVMHDDQDHQSIKTKTNSSSSETPTSSSSVRLVTDVVKEMVLEDVVKRIVDTRLVEQREQLLRETHDLVVQMRYELIDTIHHVMLVQQGQSQRPSIDSGQEEPDAEEDDTIRSSTPMALLRKGSGEDLRIKWTSSAHSSPLDDDVMYTEERTSLRRLQTTAQQRQQDDEADDTSTTAATTTGDAIGAGTSQLLALTSRKVKILNRRVAELESRSVSQTEWIDDLKDQVDTLMTQLEQTSNTDGVENVIVNGDNSGEGMGQDAAAVAVPFKNDYLCGCPACETEGWYARAPYTADAQFTCGSRIRYVESAMGYSHEDACRRIAVAEFPNECSTCNPDGCNNNKYQDTSTADNVEEEEDQDTAADISGADYPDEAANGGATAGINHNSNNNSGSSPSYKPKLTPQTPLYCYPDYRSRQRWTGIWGGDYIIETKDSLNGLCGPGDNRFTSDAVSFDTSTNRLSLRYQKTAGGGLWSGSEVRIVLPDSQMPFTYGTYRFSIKSVSIIDTSTGAVVSNALPKRLVLGLFTWDSTERFEIHENYNHEVDIELSQWGVDGNQDGQFLIQPPGEPDEYRFYTGDANDPSGYYNPGGHMYEFTWNPGSIEWYTTAGGGHTFTHTTASAVANGQQDDIQCLPANMEVRMNLWHFHGAHVAPEGLDDHQMVEVVIDNFEYIPSNIDGLTLGEACSKSCQCQTGGRCINNICTAL